MHNGSDKTPADVHCSHVEFNIGDYVMIRARQEWILQGAAKKLHAHSACPFKILRRLDPNAHVRTSPNMGISPIFNVEDPVLFRGPTTLTSDLQSSLPTNLTITEPDPPLEPEPYEPAHFDLNLTSPLLPPLSH